MLKGIDPLLGPDFLKLLREMGHGDELAIVDANFPAASHAQRLLRYDGESAIRILRAVVSVMPLDTYVDAPVHTMEVVGEPATVPPIVAEFRAMIKAAHGKPLRCATLVREAFYERAKRSFAIVATGERRLYGNVLLTKGVLPPLPSVTPNT